jgi:hypothetical protein
MQLKTITKQQAEKLAQAVELLGQANVLMQEGLGACDFCYEANNLLENLQDDLEQIADQQQVF